MMRKRFVVLGTALLFAGIGCRPALANMEPAGFWPFFWAAWLLLPSMMLLTLLTLLGGGYAIRQRRRGTSLGVWRRLLGVGSGLGAILVFPTAYGLAVRLPPPLDFTGALGLVLALAALVSYRGIQLVRWGWLADTDNPPVYLAGASPLRLLPAGVLLLLAVGYLGATMSQTELVVKSSRRSPYSRAASDTKTAVTQAIVYANDKGVYPTSLKILRESGYANVLDTDPWGHPYILSPQLRQGAKLNQADDLYIRSRGPRGIGQSRQNVFSPGKNGAGGYSSL